MSDKKVLTLEEVLAGIKVGGKGPFTLDASLGVAAVVAAVSEETESSVTVSQNKAEGTVTITIGQVATEALAPEAAKAPQGSHRVKDGQ